MSRGESDKKEKRQVERKHESDLTKKEKRQRELDKLKSMSLGGKIEYIWMYYKVWFAAVLVIAAGVYLGVCMHEGRQENVLVQAAIVGGNGQDTGAIKELKAGIKDWMGADGKHDVVRIQNNIPEDGGEITSKTALTTLFGANAIDVLVCPADIYHDYEAQDGFVDMDSLLGDAAAGYAPVIEGSSVVLPNTGFVKKMFEVNYDKVYLAVPINAQHEEGAKAFVEYVLQHM